METIAKLATTLLFASLTLIPLTMNASIIVIFSRQFGDMANIRDKAIGAQDDISYYISSIDINAYAHDADGNQVSHATMTGVIRPKNP